MRAAPTHLTLALEISPTQGMTPAAIPPPGFSLSEIFNGAI